MEISLTAWNKKGKLFEAPSQADVKCRDMGYLQKKENMGYEDM